MAHNLEIRDGEASFVGTANMPAWHNLGTIKPQERISVEEAIKTCIVYTLILFHNIYNILLGIFYYDIFPNQY